MFDGFSKTKIDGAGCQINVVHGGSGSPLLLLHGYPQNHVEWHKVAPVLAEQFTVVCPDLRGYGDSEKPSSSADDFSVCCKRASANSNPPPQHALTIVLLMRYTHLTVKYFVVQPATLGWDRGNIFPVDSEGQCRTTVT